MSNKNMTAVEFLSQFISSENEILKKTIIEQAKAMEKKQMIDFADNYVDNCVIPNENMAIPTIKDVPQYYKETYGE
jgi:hypothetical protein